jgi:hypothetical protein
MVLDQVMKDNIAYYHIYLDDYCNWAQIFAEQMSCFEKSNLFQNTKIIKITAIAQMDKRRDILEEFCTLYPVRFEIEFLKNVHKNDKEMMEGWTSIFNKTNNVSETYTLSKMYRDSQCELYDYNILYFHMKGITSTLNNLIVPSRVSKYKNRYDWRQFLNSTITNWKVFIECLEHYDVAGVDFQDEPSKHFRGNFFWTKSSHVRTLPDPEPLEWWEECKQRMNDDWMNKVSDRFRDEQWICYKDNVKTVNLLSNHGSYNSNDI